MTEVQALRLVGLVISAGVLVLLFMTLGEMRRAGPDTRSYSRWYRLGILLMIGAVGSRAYCYFWALQLGLPGAVQVTGVQVNAWTFTMSASWWLAAAATAAWCRALIWRSWRIVYAREHHLAPFPSDAAATVEQTMRDTEPPKPRVRKPSMHREATKRGH